MLGMKPGWALAFSRTALARESAVPRVFGISVSLAWLVIRISFREFDKSWCRLAQPAVLAVWQNNSAPACSGTPRVLFMEAAAPHPRRTARPPRVRPDP